MSSILLIAWGLKSGLARKRKIGLGLIILVISSITITPALLFGFLESPYPNMAAKSYGHHQTAIVLGGYVGDRTRLNQDIRLFETVDRLHKAKLLLDERVVERVLLTGGNVFQEGSERPEAEVAKELLVSWGVDPKRILVESSSRTTMQNALYSFELIGESDKEVLLVTSAYHMRRAMWAFKKSGFEPTAVSSEVKNIPQLTALLHWRYIIPSAQALRATNEALHEIIGLLAYRVIYR